METYISRQKNQLLDSLENQVRFSQLVVIVVGDKGVGKTFLIQHLKKRVENDVLVAKIDASLTMTGDQLEKAISLQLGLSWEKSESSLVQRIQNNLAQKVLITIDDSQLLSNSCLDFMLKLNQKQCELNEPIIFILLAGIDTLPGLISETETFKEHQEMCVVFQIEPIQLDETRAMITDFGRNELELVNELNDEKKLKYFWQLSKGNPAELNFQLSRWIRENSGPLYDENQTVEKGVKKKSSFLMNFMYIVIASILLTVLIFQDKVNSLFEVKQASNTPGEVISAVAVLSEKRKTIDNSKLNHSLEKESDRSSLFAQVEENNTADSTTEINGISTSVKIDKVFDKKEALNIGKKFTNKKKREETNSTVQTGLNIPKDVEIQKNQLKGKEKKTKASTVNDAVATNLQEGEVSLPDKALQEINSSSLIQSESGIVEVTKNPNNDANNKAPALSASELKAVNDLRQESESGHPEITLTKDEASLLALNDGMVVLQWAGLSRLNMAKAYKKKHPLSDRMSIYRRMSGDRLLYIIISDRFSSRDLANIAMGEYEKRGIGGEPWVKTAAAVKKDINLFIEFFI